MRIQAIEYIDAKMDYKEILDCLKSDSITLNGVIYGIKSCNFTKQRGAEMEVIKT